MIAPSYTYRARVARVIDGDSAVIDVDLGMGSWLIGQRFRLAGIDTPEIRGAERPEGLISKAWLVDRVEGREVIIETDKDTRGRYGRWIARIWIGGACVNDELLAEGLAKVPAYL